MFAERVEATVGVGGHARRGQCDEGTEPGADALARERVDRRRLTSVVVAVAGKSMPGATTETCSARREAQGPQ